MKRKREIEIENPNPAKKPKREKRLTTILQEAIKYARSSIKYGNTWMEMNQYSQKKYNEVYNQVEFMRTISQEYFKKFTFFISHPDETYRYTTRLINKIEDAKAGNCCELSILVIKYMATYYPYHFTELFSIEGGDHMFVVVNREPGSDPKDPTTWGSNCYICDPYANKFYHAANYRIRLQNYYRKNDKNHLENFDPKRHELLNTYLTSDTFHAAHREGNLTNLKSLFKIKLHLLRALCPFLLKTFDNVTQENKKDQFSILIKQILDSIQAINNLTETNYDDLKDALKKYLEEVLQNFNDCFEFGAFLELVDYEWGEYLQRGVSDNLPQEPHEIREFLFLNILSSESPGLPSFFLREIENTKKDEEVYEIIQEYVENYLVQQVFHKITSAPSFLASNLKFYLL